MMADDMAIENLPTYAPTGHIARRSCPAAELYDDVCVCVVLINSTCGESGGRFKLQKRQGGKKAAVNENGKRQTGRAGSGEEFKVVSSLSFVDGCASATSIYT